MRWHDADRLFAPQRGAMLSLPPQMNTSYHCLWYGTRGSAVPVFIGVHGTVGTDSRQYIATGGNGRKISIHRLIQKFPRANGTTDVDGRQQLAHGAVIYNMLAEIYSANHMGIDTSVAVGGQTYKNGACNVVSLGVEIENLQDGKDPYTEDQLLALGWCIYDWRKRYGYLPVVRHTDADTAKPKRRYDPVGLSNDEIEAWVDKATRIMETDVWSLWGNEFDLHREWAIPQAWAKRAAQMGKPISDEKYVFAAQPYSTQLFEHGFCVYYGAEINRARAILYTEI